MSSSNNSKKQELVFILGLSHTGSTLLDLTLGNHPRFLGLGEVYQVIRPDFNRFENNERCSCGNTQTDCPFWGPAGEILKKNKDADIQKRYKLVIDVFREVFGEERVPVDSSKLPEALELVRLSKTIDLKVIYLIRDVRAWTISRLNARKRSPEYFGKSGMYIKKLAYRNALKMRILKSFVPFLTARPSYYFLLWYYQNRWIKSFLAEKKISYLSMSYEELGLHSNRTIPKLYQYLSVEENIGSLSAGNSQSHVLIGNVKKADPERRRGIIYDNQWMYRNEWLLPAAVFRKIMKYNTREVYRNIRNSTIWQ